MRGLQFSSSCSRGVLVSLALAGCAVDRDDSEGAEGSVVAPIVGGTPDRAHEAVAALLTRRSASRVGVCSGTTIATQGNIGVFLTAAHCVVQIDDSTNVPIVPLRATALQDLRVVPGTDWLPKMLDGDYFEAVSSVWHPQYDGTKSADPYDVAVVRYTGVTGAVPTIPILSSSADDLRRGSKLVLVGYGVTGDAPENTTRFTVESSVDQLTELQIAIDQTSGKGGCEGDSGGPMLYQTPAGERIAGITSGGDAECGEIGIAVRASRFESFVNGVLGVAGAGEGGAGEGTSGYGAAGGRGGFGGAAANGGGTSSGGAGGGTGGSGGAPGERGGGAGLTASAFEGGDAGVVSAGAPAEALGGSPSLSDELPLPGDAADAGESFTPSSDTVAGTPPKDSGCSFRVPHAPAPSRAWLLLVSGLALASRRARQACPASAPPTRSEGGRGGEITATT